MYTMLKNIMVIPSLFVDLAISSHILDSLTNEKFVKFLYNSFRRLLPQKCDHKKENSIKGNFLALFKIFTY